MSQLLSDVRAGGGLITAVNGGNNITVNTVAGVATVNVSGTTNHAVQVGNALGALTSLGIGVAGQVLTSNGPGLDPSFQNASFSALTFDGNTGSANPIANIINIITANSTFKTSAAGNTVTLDFFQSNSNIGADLLAITTGVRNTGYGAGVNQSLTSGTDNTTVGYGAFVNATTAIQNVAIGTQALNANVVADDNIAVGFQALTLCTGSFENVAIGTRSMASLTNGDSNVAVGYLSLLTNSSGSDNVAIGSGALGNATNDLNIALGFQAGINASTNNSCIYIGNAGVAAENNTIRIGTDGNAAGQQNTTVIAGDVASVRSFTAILGNITATLGDVVITSGNLEIDTASNAAGTKGYITYTGAGAANRFIHARGTQNFFAGFQAGNATLTTGTAIGNTGVGFQSLQALTGGGANTALGQSAGTAITSGNRNTAIGLDALELLTSGSDNIALGQGAGATYTTESGNICIGLAGVAADASVTRIANIYGTTVGGTNAAVFIDNTGKLGTVGGGGGTPINTLTGDIGGAISPTAGNINIITDVAAVNSGSTVNFSGSASTLTFNVSDGSGNTLIGFLCGNNTLASSDCTGLGYGCLQSLDVNGNSNTAVGFGAYNALTTGFDNVGIGMQVGVSITTGQQNTLIGHAAGLNLTTSANFNTLVGAFTGQNYTSTESNNICIGQGVTGTLGESNVIRIGNASNNACFITGIDGVNVGSTAKVVTEGSDQLGTATITAGSNVSIGTSANTITINALGGGAVTWSVITANQTAAVNNGYFCNKAGTLALALPATSAVGDVIEVVNINTATGVQFTQAAGQQIFVSTASTTLGATGTLTSSAIGDTIKLVCRTANTTWWATSMIGNWTPA